MKAEEIREAAKAIDTAAKSPEWAKLSAEGQAKALLVILGTVSFSMVCEVAAQLAEANEHLAKIANPEPVAVITGRVER